jgi:RNA polymerase sigma-54 factor
MNLTLSLRQKLGILQMSQLELTQTLNNELAKNPFLEFEDISYEEESHNYNHMHVQSIDDSFDPMSLVEYEKSPYENIAEQIGFIVTEGPDRIIAAYLMNLLQDSGYIELDIDVATLELKTTSEHILRVLRQLQTLEPSGIFARNLKECLEMQIKAKEKFTKIFEIILDNLQMIASHDFDKLAKLCAITKAELLDHISLIKKLNPKPCAGLGYEIIGERIADVILEVDKSGNITVRANKGALPNVMVNKDYHASIKQQVLSVQDKSFISNEYQNATNIVRSVGQRIKTIVEVAEAIAEKQKDFFTKGVMYLKPLTLAEIAFVCGMNESTISRATSNKYIQTPTGIYEMKFFFSSSLKSKNASSDISSRKVKEIIRSLIEAESLGFILSDDDIASELEKFNIKIARRTVAKYRESMNIPTSNLRKRISRNSA